MNTADVLFTSAVFLRSGCHSKMYLYGNNVITSFLNFVLVLFWRNL